MGPISWQQKVYTQLTQEEIDELVKAANQKFVNDMAPWYWGMQPSDASPVKPEKLSCTHEWKETLGIFRVYKDCKLCAMKWEDYDKATRPGQE